MRDLLLRLVIVVVMAMPAFAAGAECDPADYQETTQADLIRDREDYLGRKVQVTGVFLFTGSDFCYQIRKTKIQTKDYFCFALGTPSLVRLYLKKDHAQADSLLKLKKGAKVTAYGTFDSQGADFNYVVVDGIAVEPAG